MMSIPVLNLFKTENEVFDFKSCIAWLQLFLVLSNSVWLHIEETVHFSLLENSFIEIPECKIPCLFNIQ